LLVDPETDEELPLRRSRGYAPLPVRLPFSSPPILAVGGELKNTFCLASGRDAFMSQHIGDMGSLETLTAFERSTSQMARLYGIDPVQLVADTHPGYQTRRWAERASGDPSSSPVVLAEVQHHHAHVASVMAEHGVPLGQRVIGVAFDGTGYGGDDGTVWGSEILVAGYRDAERVGSLAPVALPGGDAAIRRPCRVALAHLWAAGIEWSDDLAPVGALEPDGRAVLARQLSRAVGCVLTSSMGRLFDAMSSVLGLCHTAGYEAQAAMQLQWAAEAALAHDPGSVPPYRFAMNGRELQPAPVLRAVVADQRAGLDAGVMAAGFHVAVARAVGDAVAAVRDRTGIEVVALSGGVFQNTLLLALARRELAARGFNVLTHRQLPPNDGGLALGQAAVAAARAGGGVPGSAPAGREP
jgi:hydrogenase maturation protein HypF